MGKMLPMLLLIVAINLSIVVFIGADPPGSSLWTLVFNPQDWGSLSLISLVVEASTLAALGGIAIGSFIGAKTDFLVFAGITGVFLSFGISFATLYNEFNAWEVLGPSHSYIATILAAPLVISYLYTILKFWRNAD
jgi:hypothetical protein